VFLSNSVLAGNKSQYLSYIDTAKEDLPYVVAFCEALFCVMLNCFFEDRT